MTFCIVVGHTEQAQGAKYPQGVITEYVYNKGLAEEISCSLGVKDHEGFIIKKDGMTDKKIAELVNDYNPSACIELHCNAFNQKVTGTEVLYTGKHELNIILSSSIQVNLIENFNRSKKDRGTKKLKPKHNGYDNLDKIEVPACLVETFFIDNKNDLTFGLMNIQKIAEAISNGLIDFAEAYPT